MITLNCRSPICIYSNTGNSYFPRQHIICDILPFHSFIGMVAIFFTVRSFVLCLRAPPSFPSALSRQPSELSFNFSLRLDVWALLNLPPISLIIIRNSHPLRNLKLAFRQRFWHIFLSLCTNPMLRWERILPGGGEKACR